MSKKSQTSGEIIIPFGAIPLPHELIVANVLINTGYNVEFIPIGKLPTADIHYRKLIWEIKSPTGQSNRTIENNLRCALRQSSNVILDLHRIHIPEEKCFNYLKNHFKNFHGLKRLLVTTKNNQIYSFSSKSTCFSKIAVLK